PFTLRSSEASCSDGRPSTVLRWSQSDGATSYSVRRYNPGMVFPLPLAMGLPNTTHEFTDAVAVFAMTPGETYMYDVMAINGVGAAVTEKVVVTAREDCPAMPPATGEFSASVTPAATTLARSASQTFTVSTSGQLPGVGATIRWELADAT